MDLKKEISLGSGKRGKAPVYPTKTTINLVDTEKKRGNLLTQLALFVIVLALIGIFAKYAVVDPLASSMASSNAVGQAQMRLDELTAANADYAELNDQYDRYVVPGLNDDEQNLVDRDTVLDLLQENVMNVGYLETLSVSSNTVTATCLGADLNEISALVEKLETDERVSHVTVSTAQDESDSGRSATIKIVFKGPVDAESNGASQGEGAGNGAA